MFDTFKAYIKKMNDQMNRAVEQVIPPDVVGGTVSETYPYVERVVQIRDKKFLIRRYMPGDLPQYVTIEQQVYEPHPPWGTVGFHHDLYRVNTCYYSLVWNEQVIGYVGVRLDPHEAHITQIAVQPTHQGQGLSHLLMKEAIRHAQTYDALSMGLECRVTNHVAIHLYRESGFKRLRRLPNYYRADQSDAYYMVKPLRNWPLRVEYLPNVQAPQVNEMEQVMQLAFDSAPWTHAMLEDSTSLAINRTFIAYYATYPVAWIMYQVVAGQADVMLVGVLPDFRRQGIGSALVRQSLKKLAQEEVQEVFLEVRASNQAAQQLYQSLGFVAYHSRPNYYQEPVEDAILMKWTKSTETNQPHK
ncbi:ribosomal protein S18-alanine N-acetyltransferase [Atopobacter phocae]|uniref:ribosomal protein S18-alanine N-acetyltransferase n=1 Tax=Atopobacter phocae TaxID=136492 RepID=UPI0004726556|nr:ribosomal protein S18-alanine N-acetyltransferase [Atopobacter phocae]